MNRDRVIIVAIICMTIIFIASTVSPAGSSGKTGAGFQMETVKTGDVTWVCLTDRGTTIGCDTVEEYR